jgi:hypothetical protein
MQHDTPCLVQVAGKGIKIKKKSKRQAMKKINQEKYTN